MEQRGVNEIGLRNGSNATRTPQVPSTESGRSTHCATESHSVHLALMNNNVHHILGHMRHISLYIHISTASENMIHINL